MSNPEVNDVNNYKQSVIQKENPNKNTNNIFIKPKTTVKRDKAVYSQAGYSYMPPESWIVGDIYAKCKGSKTGNFI